MVRNGMLGAGVSVRELVDFLMDMPVGPVWIVMMMCFWNLFWSIWAYIPGAKQEHRWGGPVAGIFLKSPM